MVQAQRNTAVRGSAESVGRWHGHGLRDGVNQEEAVRRILKFLGQHLKGAADESAMQPAPDATE